MQSDAGGGGNWEKHAAVKFEHSSSKDDTIFESNKNISNHFVKL